MTEQLDKDGLFRTPIRLKGLSAGQMLMKAINKESLVTSKARGFRCGKCHKMQPAGSPEVWVADGELSGNDSDSITVVGYVVNCHSTAICHKCAGKSAALSEAIISQSSPKYSLKTQLWIGAWIFLSIASGVALGFMKGCR